MCDKCLGPPGKDEGHNRIFRLSEWFFDRTLATYRHALKWVLEYELVTLIVTVAVACLSVYLYFKVPTGFFPQQDTGRIMGSVQAAQDISFQALRDTMESYAGIVMKEPTV